MAGAISEVARQSLAMDFRRIDPTTARIVLIEAGPRIMPTFPLNLSDYVRRTLVKKGVEVMSRTRVMSCEERGVELEQGRLDADLRCECLAIATIVGLCIDPTYIQTSWP
jgi:NADH dehydrogenase